MSMRRRVAANFNLTGPRLFSARYLSRRFMAGHSETIAFSFVSVPVEQANFSLAAPTAPTAPAAPTAPTAPLPAGLVRKQRARLRAIGYSS